jgi:hypothetical protein
MKPENLLRFIEETGDAYPDAAKAEEGTRTLVKIPRVYFPPGCEPAQSAALVVIEDAQPLPQLYLKTLPTLASGNAPRSTSTAQFGGESWHTFSFNQPWNEDQNTALQFVEGRLRRFAQNE